MQEQSQKDEMRAALRGDFERLQARRAGEQAVPAAPSAPETVTTAVSAEPARAPAPAGVSEPEHAPASDHLGGATSGAEEASSAGAPTDADATPSWIDRVLGRA